MMTKINLHNYNYNGKSYDDDMQMMSYYFNDKFDDTELVIFEFKDHRLKKSIYYVPECDSAGYYTGQLIEVELDEDLINACK